MRRFLLCVLLVLCFAPPASAAPAFGWVSRLITGAIKSAPKAAPIVPKATPLLPKAAPLLPKAAPGALGAPLAEDALRAAPKGGAGEAGALGDDAARAGGREEGGGHFGADDVLGEVGQQGLDAFRSGGDSDDRRREDLNRRLQLTRPPSQLLPPGLYQPTPQWPPPR